MKHHSQSAKDGNKETGREGEGLIEVVSCASQANRRETERERENEIRDEETEKKVIDL